MIRKVIAWYRRPNKSWFADLIETLIVFIPLAFLIRTFFYGLYRVPSGSMETRLLVGEFFVSDKLTPWFTAFKRGDIIAFNAPNYDYSDNSVKNWWQRYVWGPENWTKRIIGIPGDHVEGKIEEGHPVIYLNGEKLDEPYVNIYPLLPIWPNGVPTRQELYAGEAILKCKPYVYVSYDKSKPFNQQPFYTINPELVDMSGILPVREPGTAIPEDVFDIQLGDNEYFVLGDNRLGSGDCRFESYFPGHKLDGKLIHGKIRFRLFSVDSRENWFLLDPIKHPIDFWKRVRWSRCMQTVS
ncbi:MAG: signal peptidase I [Candidatus Babeliaceae bacterium]